MAEWTSKHVRERTAEGTPLLECIRCWVELREGHLVTVRLVPSEYADFINQGQQGVVALTAQANQGKIRVSFGEVSYDFSRDMLSYVIGQPPVP